MTNTPNEFAQQLDSLFNELHEVLQKNLVNKVNKDDFERVKDQIKENFNDVIKHQKQMDGKIQQLDDKLTQLRQQMQQAQLIRESGSRMDQPPTPRSPNTPNRLDGTSQFSDNNSEIKIEGTVIAGRENKKKKKFERTKFPIIDNNELIKQITGSVYYNESVPLTSNLITNVISLMDVSNTDIIAIETCILIDLHNMAVIDEITYVWYKSFIKNPNIKTVLNLKNLFIQYGITENLLTVQNIQLAIENLVKLSEEQIGARIQNCNSKLKETLKKFTSEINKEIKDKSPDTPKES